MTHSRVDLDDVQADITVELGRKEMRISELRSIAIGDAIEFDKLAGEAFTVLIDDRPFAEGEIVVITDLMAVRITRLVDPEVVL